VELSGEVISYDLRPGQVLRVHPGHAGSPRQRYSAWPL
jgi:hypothetical protein